MVFYTHYLLLFLKHYEGLGGCKMAFQTQFIHLPPISLVNILFKHGSNIECVNHLGSSCFISQDTTIVRELIEDTWYNFSDIQEWDGKVCFLRTFANYIGLRIIGPFVFPVKSLMLVWDVTSNLIVDAIPV